MQSVWDPHVSFTSTAAAPLSKSLIGLHFKISKNKIKHRPSTKYFRVELSGFREDVQVLRTRKEHRVSNKKMDCPKNLIFSKVEMSSVSTGKRKPPWNL